MKRTLYNEREQGIILQKAEEYGIASAIDREYNSAVARFGTRDTKPYTRQLTRDELQSIKSRISMEYYFTYRAFVLRPAD